MNTLIFCFKILFYLLKLCHQLAKSTFSTFIILKTQLLSFIYLDFPQVPVDRTPIWYPMSWYRPPIYFRLFSYLWYISLGKYMGILTNRFSDTSGSTDVYIGTGLSLSIILTLLSMCGSKITQGKTLARYHFTSIL